MDLRKNKVVATLVFPVKNDTVVLARKTRKIGVGLWNGWGGAVEDGETIRQCAKREFEDESGLQANLEDLEYVGKVTFHNQRGDGRKFDVEVHMFLLKNWQRNLKPNPEMENPTFWPISDLPYKDMMPSDKDWLSIVLAGECVDGEVWHGLDQKNAERTSIRKIEKLGIVD